MASLRAKDGSGCGHPSGKDVAFTFLGKMLAYFFRSYSLGRLNETVEFSFVEVFSVVDHTWPFCSSTILERPWVTSRTGQVTPSMDYLLPRTQGYPGSSSHGNFD